MAGITVSGCSSSETPLEPPGQTPAKAKADQQTRFEKQALKIDPTGKGKIGPRAFKQP